MLNHNLFNLCAYFVRKVINNQNQWICCFMLAFWLANDSTCATIAVIFTLTALKLSSYILNVAIISAKLFEDISHGCYENCDNHRASRFLSRIRIRTIKIKFVQEWNLSILL